MSPFLIFQSFGIGYKRLYPDGQVRVHSNDPRPIIRVKPDSSSNFRRYSFVDAILALDPVGRLGLLASDYKVHFNFVIECLCLFINFLVLGFSFVGFDGLVSLIFILVVFVLLVFQIAYSIARAQFSGRLKETFLVLSDDEPRPVDQPEASGLSLQPQRHPVDPRSHGKKHSRGSDSMSVGSNAKKPDQTKSAEKK